MIWYVKKNALHELQDIAKGDTRGMTSKLHALLDQEKAFTVHGFEHSLSPATKQAFDQLINDRIFVRVILK